MSHVITCTFHENVNAPFTRARLQECMAGKKIRHFQMRTTDEFLATLDDWRVKRRPVLSRARAIHDLVTGAIKSETGASRATKKKRDA